MSVIRGKEGVEMKGLNNKEVEEARIFRIGKRKFHCKFFNLQRNIKNFFSWMRASIVISSPAGGKVVLQSALELQCARLQLLWGRWSAATPPPPAPAPPPPPPSPPPAPTSPPIPAAPNTVRGLLLPTSHLLLVCWTCTEVFWGSASQTVHVHY